LYIANNLLLIYLEISSLYPNKASIFTPFFPTAPSISAASPLNPLFD
jgi:hypothetical protein